MFKRLKMFFINLLTLVMLDVEIEIKLEDEVNKVLGEKLGEALCIIFDDAFTSEDAHLVYYGIHTDKLNKIRENVRSSFVKSVSDEKQVRGWIDAQIKPIQDEMRKYYKSREFLENVVTNLNKLQLRKSE